MCVCVYTRFFHPLFLIHSFASNQKRKFWRERESAREKNCNKIAFKFTIKMMMMMRYSEWNEKTSLFSMHELNWLYRKLFFLFEFSIFFSIDRIDFFGKSMLIIDVIHSIKIKVFFWNKKKLFTFWSKKFSSFFFVPVIIIIIEIYK